MAKKIYFRKKRTAKVEVSGTRWANKEIRVRILVMMLVFGVLTFGALFAKLYDLQINQHDFLQDKAVNQQTMSTVITASRGTIYDRNQQPLAYSATAETLQVEPRTILDNLSSRQESADEAEAKALKDHKEYIRPFIPDADYVIDGLSRILNRNREDVEKVMARVNSRYEILARRMDQETADELRRFINGEIDERGRLVPENQQRAHRIYGIFLKPDSKRYYTYDSLASNLLGYVNGDNEGAYGLEAKYNDVLSGNAGLTVTAKDNRGKPLLYQFEQYYDAENGGNLILTLDINVQGVLQKGMESMLAKFDAALGGAGIVMDVNTGGIIAMASYPTYNSNEPAVIWDEKLKAYLDEQIAKIEENKDTYESEEKYNEAITSARSSAWFKQWRNRCYQDTYEPGSTFKPITLATALEEGIINMNSTFQCNGSIMVPGWSKAFKCSNSYGHGMQSLAVATGNSCNPAFINIGLRIGTETYYKYLKSFGFMESTGFDLPAEIDSGLFASEESFNSNVVSLASYAFGQTFAVTPLQLIRAQAACINGGYLYQPYIVDQILDEEGNVVQQHEAAPIRQVVSEETSAHVRECLEYVVASGTGKNGQVAGYRIGGKTGTADKTGTKDVIVSFMCFAPADDPQYIMLITMDTPSRTTGTYVSGGNMVAPTASQIMGEILPFLGLKPNYSSEELESADVPVPNVTGLSLEDARARLEGAGFTCRTTGSSDTVSDQTPVGGAIVPNNAEVLLYLGKEKTKEPCTVPDVLGLTLAEVNERLTRQGFILRVSGVTSSASGSVRAISQNREAGTQLPAGTVIDVQFGDTSVLD